MASLVDVHAHFLPSWYQSALKEAGHLPGPDGYHKIPEWSPEDHLSFMDANNIQKSYLSVSSPGIFLTPPSSTTADDAPTTAAISLARQINIYGSNLKKQHPTRFGFFASLPLPNISATLAEIEFCAKEVKVDGFVMLTNAFGLYLGDPRMAPIYEVLNAQNAVIFVHPTVPCTAQNAYPHSSSSAKSSTQPSDAPSRLGANMPLADSYAGPMMEFMFDSTRNFSDLLLTGTVAQYSNIRWIIPHCGATIPSILDRIIRFSQVLPQKVGSQRKTTALNEAGVKRVLADQVYFDLAGLPINSQIHHVLRWCDYTRLMYGSDVPFTPWDMATKVTEEVRQGLLELFGAETGDHEMQRICHGNAEQLFGAH